MVCERVVVDEVGAVMVCPQQATRRTAEEVAENQGLRVAMEHWCDAHLAAAVAERPGRVEVPRSAPGPVEAVVEVRCSASTYRGKTGGAFGPGEFNRCVYVDGHSEETHLDTWGHRFRIAEGKVRILGVETPPVLSR